VRDQQEPLDEPEPARERGRQLAFESDRLRVHGSSIAVWRPLEKLPAPHQEDVVLAAPLRNDRASGRPSGRGVLDLMLRDSASCLTVRSPQAFTKRSSPSASRRGSPPHRPARTKLLSCEPSLACCTSTTTSDSMPTRAFCHRMHRRR